MHNRIYEFIMKNNKALDVEIDDIVNGNADFMIFFVNKEGVLNNIQQLKKEIEETFNTEVHIPIGQIEDQLNDKWEVLNIDFYIDVREMDIEDFFKNKYTDIISVEDNKKECEMKIICKNIGKDWNSFKHDINEKIQKLKKQYETVDCEFNWVNHNDWDDEYIATIKIYYEDYDE